MPVTAYEDLKAEFEKIRAEYFAKRDEVLAKWDFLVADFKAGAKEMLEGIHMPDYQREQVLQSFVKEIPSEGRLPGFLHGKSERQGFPRNLYTGGSEQQCCCGGQRYLAGRRYDDCYHRY